MRFAGVRETKMSKQRARVHPGIRLAVAATAGIAVLGVTAVPAHAALPTPQSLGMPNFTPAWAKAAHPPTDCALATRCKVAEWSAPTHAVLLLQSGYVKGQGQARYRTTQAKSLFAQVFEGQPNVKRKSVTQTYLQRKHQHRLKMRILTVRIAATLGDPTIYAQHVIAQDSVRVKRGTRGKFAHKIGFGELLLERATDPIPSKLNRKHYRLLGKEMRKLIRAGARYKLTGPARSPS